MKLSLLRWKPAWTGCILIVVVLRLIYAAIGYWVVASGGPIPLQEDVYSEIQPYLHSDGFSTDLVNPWFGWDTISYLKIAILGYQKDATVAFMPLYPLLVRALAPLLGGNYLLAALTLSTLFAALTLILLYELVRDMYSEQLALRTVIFYIAFPTSFFLLAGYTESLFMTCVLAFWILARKRLWLWAGLFAGLATLTRLQGVVLSAVMVWMILLTVLEQPQSTLIGQIRQLIASRRPFQTRIFPPVHRTAWLAIPIPLVLMVLYQTWLKSAGYGTIAGALHKYWHLETVAPWHGFVLFLERLPSHHFNYMDWIDLALFILVLILSIVGLRRLDPAFSIYIWLTIAVLLTRGTPPHLLASYSRYFLALFPLALFPSVSVNRLGRLVLITGSFGLHILLVSIFLWGSWVA